jgi:methyl-accepting chemotaxis protein
MAGEREREKLLEQLRDEAELVRRINEDTGGYIEFVKKIKAIKSNIAYLEKQISKATGEQKDILEEELRQVKELEVRYKRIAKETSNIVKAQEFSASALQTSKNLLGGITSAYGSIVSYTRYLAEIDKKIKMSALNMGILDTNKIF